MFCPVCKRNNPDGQQFCMYCGKQLTVDIEPPVQSQPIRVQPEQRNYQQKNAPQRLHPAIIVLIIVAAIALLAIATAIVYSAFSSSQPQPPYHSESTMGYTNEDSYDDTVDQTDTIVTAAPHITPAPKLPTPAPKRNNAAEIRNSYYSRAAEIEDYSATYLDTAMSQYDLNQESAIVYQKWDALLNDVYQYLKANMAPGAFANLKADETNWYQKKDRAIEEAGAEWAGGSGEPMARNMTGIEWTQERCYYLISLIN